MPRNRHDWKLWAMSGRYETVVLKLPHPYKTCHF